MTQTEPTGEQREAKRRRNFWLMTGGLMAAGMIAGMLSGLFEKDSGLTLDPAWAVAFILIIFVTFVWLSIVFFKRVDELELADNLWAGLFGIYFYIAAQPSWHVLHQVDLVGPIQPWPIYFATLFVSIAAYLGRKLLNR